MENIKEILGCAVKLLIGNGLHEEPLTGIDISEQFRPEEKTREAFIRNLNAAFLISLCGPSHPHYSQAGSFMEDVEGQTDWKDAVEFYRGGLVLVLDEIKEKCAEDDDFRQSLDQLHEQVRKTHRRFDRMELLDEFWRVFFPEGVSLFEKRAENIESLRKKREIRIHGLNPNPIRDPAEEVLFTSNVLMTVPSSAAALESTGISKQLKTRLERISAEEQLYWYDHPIPIGIEKERNEVVYGLGGLDEAVAFEKRRGTVEKEKKIQCVLSVSVTHAGLHGVARSCLEDMFRQVKAFEHLRIYALTESDTAGILREIFVPAAGYFFGKKEEGPLSRIFGVDGEYGRHYSFLKAVAAFWQVFLDPHVRATFKIDLDQVFPQEDLVRETGFSALEHLMTPLWGAQGEDTDGNSVELGMIAGALVNRKDIHRSLFTPDVGFPDDDIKADEWIFCSRLPQALSTEAEMMTLYENGDLNGLDRCIQRFHVTGGTCGILVKNLRRVRPFTPGFIGRAEDQAYLMSVLYQSQEENLRYVHKDGLIMRHDKEAFASDVIKSSYAGKLIGDYIRILVFSDYAKNLPWSLEKTKKCIDPFTGCFVSHIPYTVVYLRLALMGASYFRDAKTKEGVELLEMGTVRLNRIMKELTGRPGLFKERVTEEREAWNTFYDILERIEQGLKERDPFVLDLQEKAGRLIKACEISV